MVTAYTRTNTLHGHCDHCACAACALHTTSAEQVGRAALKLLEVVPGLSVWELLMREWEGRDVNQIGRQPPLSSNKATSHFPRLKEATGEPPCGKQPPRGSGQLALAASASLGQPRLYGRCVPVVAGHTSAIGGHRP
jgi:hypothetical protein